MMLFWPWQMEESCQPDWWRELNINQILFIPIKAKNKKITWSGDTCNVSLQKCLYCYIYDTGEIFSKVYDLVKILDCDFAVFMSRYKKIIIVSWKQCGKDIESQWMECVSMVGLHQYFEFKLNSPERGESL